MYMIEWSTINPRDVTTQKNGWIRFASLFLCRETDGVSSVPTVGSWAYLHGHEVLISRLRRGLAKFVTKNVCITPLSTLTSLFLSSMFLICLSQIHVKIKIVFFVHS